MNRVKTESGKRCDAETLKKILRATPVIIEPGARGSKFRAYMGLGKIVYIEPSKGQILSVKLGQDVYKDYPRSGESHEVFNYKGLTFSVAYKMGA